MRCVNLQGTKLGVDKFNFAPIMYYSPFEMKPLKSLSCESLLGFVSLCLDFMNNDNSSDAIDIRICMTKAMAYELFLKENILTGKIEEYIYRGNKMRQLYINLHQLCKNTALYLHLV